MKKDGRSDCLFFFLYLAIYLYFFFTECRTGRFSEAFLFSSWLVVIYFIFIVFAETGIITQGLIRGKIQKMKNFIKTENIRKCDRKGIEHNGGYENMQKCPYCGAWFRTKKALNIHITKRHKKKKKRR